MLVKSYQFTGIDFGHLGQVVPNNMKQSGIKLLLGSSNCARETYLVRVKRTSRICHTEEQKIHVRIRYKRIRTK